jgi:hypothetical protein
MGERRMERITRQRRRREQEIIWSSHLLYTKVLWRDIIPIMSTSMVNERAIMEMLNRTRASYFFNPGLTRLLRTTRTKYQLRAASTMRYMTFSSLSHTALMLMKDLEIWRRAAVESVSLWI